MKTRWLLFLVALTGATAALLGCPGPNTCSAANCSGCCDANGTCVTGTSSSQCGRSGAACTACSSGLACVANACTSAMGGGGGTTGGGGGAMGGGTGGSMGGGGGTAGDAGCTMVDFSGATGLGGSFTPAASNGNPAYNAGFLGKPSATANRFDYLGVELWYFGGSANPTFPYVFTLAPTTYQDCEVCLIYQEACDNMGGNCARSYLGQGGTVTFTAATQNPNAGQFASTGQDVQLREWDLMNDRAASGNRCVQLNYSMSVSWDAGAGDGGPGDGGTGGDAGVGDGGLGDGGLGDGGLGDGGLDDGGLGDGGLGDGGLGDGGLLPDGGIGLLDGGLLPDGGIIP